MRTVFDFINQFTRKQVLDEKNLHLIDETKIYLVNKHLRDVAAKISLEPFMIGIYLGKSKGKTFFPTFPLLNMIKYNTSSRVWIDKPTEWLYICDRDIFSKGITKATGHTEKGGIPLILNRYGEVLGFGKIIKKLTQKTDPDEVVVNNILDIGDFLRREKNKR